MERANRIVTGHTLTLEEQKKFGRHLLQQKTLGKQLTTGAVVRQRHEKGQIEALTDREYTQAFKKMKLYEIKHPQEFSLLIDVFNTYITHKFNLLNIIGDATLVPEQIHIVHPLRSEHIYNLPEKNKEDLNTLGIYHPIKDVIYLRYLNLRINQLSDFGRTLVTASTLIHEAFHRSSFHQFIFNDNEVSMNRSGYEKCLASNRSIGQFDFLNEYMTDRLMMDFFQENGKYLVDSFGSPTALMEHIRYVYYLSKNAHDHDEIFDTLIKRISFKIGKTVMSVLRRFKDAYFTGDMTHLKWIEETFGRQSLRLIATIQSNDHEGQKELLDYIKTKNPDLKEKLIKKYLHSTEHTSSAK